MVKKPVTRNVLSSISLNMRIVLRMPAGFKNGRMPSMTSNRANADNRSVHILCFRTQKYSKRRHAVFYTGCSDYVHEVDDGKTKRNEKAQFTRSK